MKTANLFPSRYVKAADLADGPQIVTMREIVLEEIGQGKERTEKGVLYFQNRNKGLVLNLTNSRTIEDAYGDEMDEWPGKEIELYATKVDLRGDRVDAVRVRVPKPPSADELIQAPLRPERGAYAEQCGGSGPAELDDEIPFAPLRDLP